MYKVTNWYQLPSNSTLPQTFVSSRPQCTLHPPPSPFPPANHAGYTGVYRSIHTARLAAICDTSICGRFSLMLDIQVGRVLPLGILQFHRNVVKQSSIQQVTSEKHDPTSTAVGASSCSFSLFECVLWRAWRHVIWACALCKRSLIHS